MSEEIALAAADADHSIAAIRARWASIAWHYAQNSLSGRYIGDAWIYDTTERALIDMDEPSESEVAFLRLVAQAPSDIQALLGEIDRAKTARDAWTEIGAQSADVLAQIRLALDATDGYHAFGERVEYLLDVQSPRTRALLDLVSAAAAYPGSHDTEHPLLTAALAFKAAMGTNRG